MSKVEISVSLEASCGSVLIAAVNSAGNPVLMEQIDNPESAVSTVEYSREFYYKNPNELKLLVLDGSNGQLLADSGSNQLLNTTIGDMPNNVLSADIIGCTGTDSEIGVRLRNMFLENGIVIPPDIVEVSTSKTWFIIFIIVVIILLAILIWWLTKKRQAGTQSSTFTRNEGVKAFT